MNLENILAHDEKNCEMRPVKLRSIVDFSFFQNYDNRKITKKHLDLVKMAQNLVRKSVKVSGNKLQLKALCIIKITS